MTWEELVAKAKEIGYIYERIHGIVGRLYCQENDLSFYEDGDIYVYADWDDWLVAKDRTPDQMWQIMEALR